MFTRGVFASRQQPLRERKRHMQSPDPLVQGLQCAEGFYQPEVAHPALEVFVEARQAPGHLHAAAPLGEPADALLEPLHRLGCQPDARFPLPGEGKAEDFAPPGVVVQRQMET